MGALVYQQKTDGSYIVMHRESGTQLGTVRKMTFGRPIAVWYAKPILGEECTQHFSDRKSAGQWLLHVARSANQGCELGCTCAEG